jgi:hypothetical protein
MLTADDFLIFLQDNSHLGAIPLGFEVRKRNPGVVRALCHTEGVSRYVIGTSRLT